MRIAVLAVAIVVAAVLVWLLVPFPVTPPTVAVPLIGCQFGIQNQLGRLTIWSPAGLEENSGTGM